MFIACLAGYIWLYFGLNTNNGPVHVCLIKHTTNVPCPSCGSTRSVVSLSKGNFKEAFMINPFGYIISFIMLIAPVWIVIDIAAKKKTLFEFYKRIELTLKKPQYTIPLILLVIFNWIWNIGKGL